MNITGNESLCNLEIFTNLSADFLKVVCRALESFKTFLSATEYHCDADHNSRQAGVVVVVVINIFKKWIILLCLDGFASYLVGSCTRVRRFTSYPIFVTISTGPTSLPTYE